MKLRNLTLLTLTVLIYSCAEQQSTQNSAGTSEEIDRTVLPIKEPAYPAISEMDARKATPPPRFVVKAPEKAPNLLPTHDLRRGLAG